MMTKSVSKEMVTDIQEMTTVRRDSQADRRHHTRCRVLFVPPGALRNQYEPHYINLIKDLLRAKGWAVGVFPENIRSQPKSDTFFHYNGFIERLTNQTTFVRDLRRALFRYDTIHLFYLSATSFLHHVAPALCLGRFYGKRVILSYQRHEAEVELEKTVKWILPFLQLCDVIAVSSNYSAKVLAQHNIHVGVLPHPIDTNLFQPRTINRVQPKLMVTRAHEKRNNISCAIEAYKIVKQKYPRTEMVITGDGSQREELQTLAAKQKLNGVNFTGEMSQQQLARHFADADVYVNCSTIDGLPASMLEALAVGLPVVTTNVGGIGEIITDGVNGLLVRPNDPVGLADRLIELIESPELAAKLSENAKQSVQGYAWSQVQKKWLSVYDSLSAGT
jgi:glycosyltransferase involved in cell wall biosynthesis